MSNTKIEWAEKVWNPVTGCTKISPGCKNCYAERMAKRLAGRSGYPKDNPFQITLHPDRLDQPLHWKKPSRIFVCSMGDLFHKDVPDDFIDDIFTTIMLSYHHKYLILTKRPERMLEYINDLNGVYDYQKAFFNVWLGVSVENQQTADERIPILLQIPAAKRFVSYEPIVDALSFRHEWRLLDWFIMGSESGANRRLTRPSIVKVIIRNCGIFNIPLFIKQLDVGDGKGLVKMPKINGKVYNQYPEGNHA